MSSGRRMDIGGEQNFRNEENAIAEVDADDAHAFDQRLGQDPVGRPAAAEEDMDGRLDLFLEAVIEVVMNLLHQLLVIEAVQVKFAFIAHRSLQQETDRPL